MVFWELNESSNTWTKYKIVMFENISNKTTKKREHIWVVLNPYNINSYTTYILYIHIYMHIIQVTGVRVNVIYIPIYNYMRYLGVCMICQAIIQNEFLMHINGGMAFCQGGYRKLFLSMLDKRRFSHYFEFCLKRQSRSPKIKTWSWRWP